MELHLGRAFQIVLRTTPYMLNRAIVYGGIAVAVLGYVAALGLVGYIFSPWAFWVMLILSIVLAAAAGLQNILGLYVLDGLKAGHMALVSEVMIEDGPLRGTSQSVWARDKVQHFYREPGSLTKVHRLVRGVLKRVNRSIHKETTLAFTDSASAVPVADSVTKVSLVYIDDAFTGYTFYVRNENVYDAARKAILLYAQAGQNVLKNAVALTVLGYMFMLAMAVVVMVPMGALSIVLLQDWPTLRFMLFLAAVFLGLVMKWIAFDPIASTATLIAFLESTRSATIAPDLESRIEQETGLHGILREKAAQFAKDRNSPMGRVIPMAHDR
jgi:hypothetical protein